MKKTKSNKQKLVLKWSNEPFTIADIQKQHPNAVNITIRHRINQAIHNKELTAVGILPMNMGRPTLLFLKNPVSNERLIEAVKMGGKLNEKYSSLVVSTIPSSISLNSKVKDIVEVKEAVAS